MDAEKIRFGNIYICNKDIKTFPFLLNYLIDIRIGIQMSAFSS